jgi:hypothetical protein
LLELAAQLERIANAPPGADPGRFPDLPYHDDLAVLRCRVSRAGRVGALVGVLVNEAIDEPDEEWGEPAKRSMAMRVLGGLFWIGFLLVLLLGAKELIKLLVNIITRFL